MSQDDLADRVKQSIAFEMNLSETAFVARRWGHNDSSKDDDKNFTLRWFTPETEVPLCGHATLASAAVIFHRMKNSLKVLGVDKKQELDESTSIHFRTRFKGILSASMDWSTGRISLDFPTAVPRPINPSTYPPLDPIVKAVLSNISRSGSETHEIESIFYSPETKKLLIRLKGSVSSMDDLNQSLLMSLKPDFHGMIAVPDNDLIRGVIVTIKGSDNGINFYSRYFAPWVGINEDPVTGSAHTVLIPFWFKQYPGLRILWAMQSSKRGGHLFCRMDGERVYIEGAAKLLIEGSFNI